MSLDMTMGTREAALDAAASRSRRKRLPSRGSGCRTSCAVVTGTAFGVLLSSLLGVLLFLR